LRDLARPSGIPRRVGPRRQRPRDHEPRSDADAVFDVSVPGAALDRPARRVETADDLPARQAIDEHVPALLSRCPGRPAAAISIPPRPRFASSSPLHPPPPPPFPPPRL